MKHIAVFASGSGTNAENLALYFRNSSLAKVSLIVCNTEGAGVIARATQLGIPLAMIPTNPEEDLPMLMGLLQQYHIDFIVLAGFLRKVPTAVLQAYPHRVVNIHPALLPAYGGRGMYGMRVHRAVLEAGDSQSGITIHYVNENYDEGDIVFQAHCAITAGDTPDILAEKVHALEYKYFPEVVENMIAEI